jgi:uncharacterized oxidoreductase
MILEGNTVFITGGGSGIGRGLAEAFHKHGNQVIIGGRRMAALDETAAANPGIKTIVFDVADKRSISQGAAELIRRFPDLNVVVNNAGVQKATNFAGKIDERDFEAEIDTNIYGVLRVTSAFLEHLKEKPSATIVNVSSGLAFMPMARFPVYCATKAFVHSFSMTLRRQLSGTSVRVIELAPPWVVTDLGGDHTPPVAREGRPGPMPLAGFIEAAMQGLASDVEELPVAGAKFLYDAGVAPGAAAAFGKLNAG